MSRLRHIVKWLGTALAVAALAYVVSSLAGHWQALAAWRPGAATLWLLAALAVCYGALLFLLAESWHRIVGLFGAEPRSRTVISYAVTQIARYLPGNVAHVLGRAAWLRGGALGAGDLARASLLELLVTPAGACLALVLMSPAFAFGPALPLPPALSDIAPQWLGVLALGGCGAGIVAFRWLFPGLRLTGLLGPLALSTLFMLGLGAIFAGVAQSVADIPFATAMAVGLGGWIVGYATPGAPGGLGPREALIALALGGSDAVLIALLFRAVTTLGDLLCFAAGLAASRKRIRAVTP